VRDGVKASNEGALFRWRRIDRAVRLRLIKRLCWALTAGYKTDTSDLEAILAASPDISNDELVDHPEALLLRGVVLKNMTAEVA
jgi:hypothetical protein